jgi:signal transduction histidine kinase
MTREPGRLELLAWGAAALAGGAAIAALEVAPGELQSGLLCFLLAGFWLSLPGHAVTVRLAIAAGLAGPLWWFLGAAHRAPSWLVPLFMATMIGIAAARVAGGLAHDEEHPSSPGPWYAAPLQMRTLVAIVVSLLVTIGFVPIFRTTQRADWPVSLATVRWWQLVTFVMWVLATPLVIMLRDRVRGVTHRRTVATGVTAVELAAHLGLVTALTTAHVLMLRTMPVMLARAAEGGDVALPVQLRRMAEAYLPFDLLAYAAILGVAFLSDTERRAREADEREAVATAHLLEARLSALRARLNPHFLYNALNAAVTLARTGRGEETSRLLEELTGLLRYVLDDRSALVSLDAEATFIRRFLSVQQVRFGARLRATLDVDDAVRMARVPALLLQPLVENAVEHGLASDAQAGEVRVTARAAGERLVLTVEDDGPGPGQGSARGTGIGLETTRERLATLYAGAATLSLAPRAPRGTVATIEMPLTFATDA